MSNVKSKNQEALNNFLKVPKGFRQDQARVKDGLGFSPFDDNQANKATEVTAKLMQVANDNPDNPNEKVIEAAVEEAKTKNPELVRWALMSYVTHHPAARDGKLRIPPLVKRAPGISVPKKKGTPFTAPGPALTSAPPSKHEGGNVEKLFDWIREDPNFNEHHEHWHIVYPSRGLPDPKDTKKRIKKDRHGELFIYMHRQMLARLDAERHAIGIPLIKPLENYQEPIPEGYNPNEQFLVEEKDKSPYGIRTPNLKLADFSEEYNLADMEKSRKAIEEAIKNGKFFDGSEITSDLLGATIESSNVQKEGWTQRYGSLHNSGHMLLAYIHNPSRANDSDVDPGVMHSPRVAARDPVFWRWHRHVDDFHNKWQDTLQPHDFSDAPPVKVRDIILAFKDKLPIKNGATQDKEATAFGEKTFGGSNFDKDLSKNEFVTHELQTKMKKRNWKMVEDTGKTIEIDYLFPREYYYYFRVENTSSKPLDATFRVFLVSEELAKSRRHWIELDKFKQTLSPKSKTVVCRDCDMSSVVRQPPQKTEDELDDTVTQPGVKESPSEKYCDCGWPFHLLLPRGRKGGLKYKLLLFISDWSKDEVPTLSRCGSLSFCGAETPTSKYPDIRPMGYPFDRPFKNNSYEQTFKLSNATIKDLTINWVDNFPEVKA